MRRILASPRRFGDAHDFADGDAAPLARKLIAAARSAHAFQNAGAHQRLHHLFEMALRHAMARGDLLRRTGSAARMERDVDHRCNGQQGFFGEPRHLVARALDVSPVEPKPPSPRAVAVSVSTVWRLARSARREHELRDPHAARHRKRLRPEIDQDHLHFAAIIGIDRARRVQHRDRVTERETRARAHFALKAARKFEREPGRESRPSLSARSARAPCREAPRGGRGRPRLRSRRRARGDRARAASAELYVQRAHAAPLAALPRSAGSARRRPLLSRLPASSRRRFA